MLALRTFLLLAVTVAVCVLANPDKPTDKVDGVAQKPEKDKKEKEEKVKKPNWRRPPPHKRMEISDSLISE